MGAAESSASEPIASPPSPTAKVSTIFVYPIKSCRGISVSQAPLTPFGFRWDRQWLVVNSTGRAYTQRVEPKLALVQAELPAEAFDEGWEPTDDSFMVLKAPGMEPLKVCLSKPHEVADGVSVWEWSGSAWDEGAEAAQWFSDYLEKPSRLVRFNTDSQARPVDPNYAEGHLTLFTDGFPFLLASQESLDAVNQHLEEPIFINRFRANIIVEGCEPFAEDLWTDIKISWLSFQGVKLCARCKVPSINQETGIDGPEPNQTLMKIRSGKVLRPNGKHQNKVMQTYFGQNLVWNWKESSAKGNGNIINVGDPVYVFKKVSSFAEAAA